MSHHVSSGLSSFQNHNTNHLEGCMEVSHVMSLMQCQGLPCSFLANAGAMASHWALIKSILSILAASAVPAATAATDFRKEWCRPISECHGKREVLEVARKDLNGHYFGVGMQWQYSSMPQVA